MNCGTAVDAGVCVGAGIGVSAAVGEMAIEPPGVDAAMPSGVRAAPAEAAAMLGELPPTQDGSVGKEAATNPALIDRSIATPATALVLACPSRNDTRNPFRSASDLAYQAP